MNNFTKIRKHAILTLLAVFFIASGAFAQSPGSFKYQAVLRDLDGKVLPNADIEVGVSILQGSETGTPVLTEMFNVTTNMYGLTNLEVGSVDPAAFAVIDWGNGPYFIKISVDGDAVGTSQLLSVPYALHAGSADNVDDADADPTNEFQSLSIDGNELTLSNGNTVTLTGNDFDGQYSSLTGAPTNLSDFTNDTGFITDPDDADADTLNEIQMLSIDGNQVSLSNGGGEITLPEDFDTDPLNEIQILSIDENQVSLSNGGGEITLPEDFDTDPLNEIQILSIDGNQITLSDGGGVITLPEGFDGMYSSLTGTPTKVSDFINDSGFISDPDDADADPLNEIQILSINGNKLILSNGGFVILPEGFDGMYSSLTGAPTNLGDFTNDTGYLTDPDDDDADPENELQNIAKTGNIVSLSLGGGSFADSALTETQVDEMVSDNGYLSSSELGSMTYQDSNSVNIDGGEIDGTVIGFNNPEEGYFQDVEINKNIYLPKTTVEEGIVYVDNKRFIHSKGTQNTYIGEEAGQLAGNGGNDNIGVGYKALSDNTSGHSNVAVGSSVMAENGIGTQNVAVGQEAMMMNETGSYNTSLGAYSMKSNTDGSYNIALGFESLNKNTQGSDNIAIGVYALKNNEIGNSNIAVGYDALQANTTGEDNIGVGNSSLNQNTTGLRNVATGSLSLNQNTTGNGNVANGYKALNSNTTGDNNIAIGESALESNTEARELTAVGFSSLRSNTTGLANTAVGSRSLSTNTEGYGNTAAGNESLMGNTKGFDNTAMGLRSLFENTEGHHNTGIGTGALYDNTVGDYNAALGAEALYNNVFGNYNTGVGFSALYENQQGKNNTAVGNRAINYNMGGDYNTAIGDSVMYNNRPGSYNTALGKEALFMNRESSTNVALGAYSMYNQLTGEGNTATGYTSLFNNEAGNDNTAVGDSALFNNTNSRNTGLGAKALYNNTSGAGNTGVGSRILYNNTSGDKNAAMGDSALFVNSSGSRNTGVGSQALLNNNADENTAVGTQALYKNTTGAPNTAVGAMGLRSNTTGANNAAVGDSALFANETGANNSAIGSQALRNNQANNNTAVGSQSLYSNTTGTPNTAVGFASLQTNTTGFNNSGLGYQALNQNTAGSQNSAVGNRALYSNTTGSQNAAVGDSSLVANTTGLSNTAVGYRSLRTNSTGNYNTAMGQNALLLSTGGSNTALGDLAGSGLTTGDGNLFLGFRAAEDTIQGNNRLFINNDEADLNLKFADNVPPVKKGALIYGEFDNEYLRFDADLDLNGKLVIVNSTQSTAIDTGALVVTGGVGIGRRLNVGQEATFEKQVIIGAAAPSVDTMYRPTPVSSNMLIVDGNTSIGNGYINTVAPANGLLVEGNFGLGVPAPTSKMQIAGNIAPDVTTNNRTLGTPTERWTTLFMASEVNYANELRFRSGTTDYIRFATNGNATFNSNVGIGVAAGTSVPDPVGPTANIKLHVKGTSTDHIAFFENTDTGDGDGIAIKLSKPTPNSENNFITFFNGSNAPIGRVEGETSDDVWNNPEFIFEQSILIAEEVKAIVNQGTSFIPVVVAGLGASTGPCGACIAAAAADLILASANLASFNYFKFTQLGVTYESGGADYAEWLERNDPGEQISAGDIVGVNGGKISKLTTNAQQFMVVSTSPVILGNMPKDGSEILYEKVAFMGQIPVKVRGIVAAGEYIIPSGSNDGTGVAVSPDDIKPEQYKEIVGVAWSNSLLSDGVSLVNMAIGLNSNDVAQLAVKQEKKINELEKKYNSLEERLLALEGGKVTPAEKSAGLKSAAIEPEPEPEPESTPEMTRLEMLETYMPSELSREVMDDAMIYLEGEFASQGIKISDHPGLNKLYTDASYREEIIKKAQANYIVTYNKLLEEAKDKE